MADLGNVRAVQIVLTASCNLRCGYCYQNDKKSRRMDWDVLRPSLDLALASHQPLVRLLFIGGEPLLEMPSIRRAVAYVEARRRAGLTVQYEIITNGLLLGPEQALFLSEHDFKVQLSFDGVAEAQAVRGARSFEKLDALLDRLYDHNGSFFESNVSVAITLTPRTVPYLAESIEYFYRKHVAEMAVTPANGMDAEWRLEDIDELDRQFARVFKASLRLYRDTDETPLILFRKGRGRAPRSSGPRAMCGVGRGEQLAVDVDGQVHGCLTFVESYQQFPMAFLRSRVEALRLGDLRGAALAENLRGYSGAVERAGIFSRHERKYSSYGRCEDCRFLDNCAVCPMSIGRSAGADGDPHRIPDFQCAYNLVSLKYRARFPSQQSAAQILGLASKPRRPRRKLAARIRGPVASGVSVRNAGSGHGSA